MTSTLTQKRDLLYEAIEIARTVERLQEGLEATLLMGQPANEIPRHKLRFYNQLAEHLETRPDNELTGMLGQMETVIRNDLGQILQFAEYDDEILQGASADDSAEIKALVDAFRRHVQTAVCLRVLLRGRGTRTEAMEFVVSADTIQQRLQELEQRTTSHRTRLLDHIAAMQRNIEALLANPQLPETLAMHLQSALEGLHENQRHLSSGKSFDSMPVPLEALDLAAEVDDIGNWAPQEAGETETPETSEPEAETPPVSFFSCLWIWLTTPSHVSWAQIKSGEYKVK